MGKGFPFVTVVVPAYNHENYVIDCIESILSQDYPNIDLVVINDGSTDRTDEKVRGLMRQGGRPFRYISKENEGLIKTLNLGLKMSDGKYFCELASDDVLLPGSIKKRVEYLESNPEEDAVFADAYLMDGLQKTGRRYMQSRGREGYSSKGHTVKDMVEGNALILFPSGMIKRETIDRFKAFDEGFFYSEDMLFKAQLVIFCKVGYLDEPLMYYRMHSANTSKTDRFWLRMRAENILALEKLIAMYGESVKGALGKPLFRQYLKYLRGGIKNGVGSGELSWVLKKALKMRPYSARALYYLILLYLRKDGQNR